MVKRMKEGRRKKVSFVWMEVSPKYLCSSIEQALKFLIFIGEIIAYLCQHFLRVLFHMCRLTPSLFMYVMDQLDLIQYSIIKWQNECHGKSGKGRRY